MITCSVYDRHVTRLLETVKRVHAAFTDADIPYRVVGGLAVFFHVSARDPDNARVTPDIDVAVDRNHLSEIAAAAEKHGFRHQHAAGADMLVDTAEPKATTVYLIFIREKVRPDYLEPVPDFSEPTRTAEGILLAPVADLVLMKLTSYRLKDRVHI